MTRIQTVFLTACFLQIFAQPCRANESAADAAYEKGMDLAKNNQWQDAQLVLENGSKLHPQDTRFLEELAGIAFHERDYPKAGRLMQRVAEKEPSNTYANDFLGTVYLLEGNLEGALQYWNRIGKPEIVQVIVDPRPEVDSVLLDHAMVFAPAERLELRELQESEARIRMLDVFRKVRFELRPNQDAATFDLILRPVEKKNSLRSWLAFVGTALQAIFDQTVPARPFTIWAVRRGACIR
jgi:tetratricopeptide (TPR) repeat protein